MQTNEPTSSITSSSILNTDEDFFYNEQVDVIEPKTGTVHNGHIVSIRGQLLIVKFDDQKEGHERVKAFMGSLPGHGGNADGAGHIGALRAEDH